MYSKAATEACLRAQDVPLEDGRGRIAESASGGSLTATVAGDEILLLFISEPRELDSTADAYKRSGGDAYSTNNAVIAWPDSADGPTDEARGLIKSCLSATPAPGDEARDGRLSLHEYTARAGTICKEERGRFNEIRPEPTLEKARPLMKQLSAVLTTLTDRLSDLRPPERVEADVDRMLDSFAAAAAGFQKVSEAEDMAEAERRFDQDAAANLVRATHIAFGIGIDQGCER